MERVVRFIIVVCVISWCMLAQANTVRQLLAKPPPWDRERLAKIIGMDILKSMSGVIPKEMAREIFASFDIDDHEKNAMKKAREAISELIAKETPEIQHPLIWQLVDPWGGQHKILATIHTINLDEFSTGARQKLMEAIDEATVLMSETGAGGEVSLDRVLAQIGLDKGKELVALDSLTSLPDKLMLLAQMFIPTTSEQFISYLVDYIERLEFMYHIHSNYFKGDYQALQQLDFNNQILPEKMVLSMLKKRNERFVETIIDYCQRGERCFIFAGVAHMLTITDQANSIITMLQEHGFHKKRNNLKTFD